MRLTLLLFVFVLLLVKTTQTYAFNPIDKLFEYTQPTFMDNCDSEYVKEYEDYDYKNPPATYSNVAHWFNEIKKAEQRKDYCRKSQALNHMYGILPWKEFHELEIQKQVVESLFKGKYFLELQWQIKNYREMYGRDEEVELMQVMSYWPYIDEINRTKNCIAPTGYYTNPKTRKDYNLVTEAYLSSNDFLKDFADSAHAERVASKVNDIKQARILGLMCTAKNSLAALQRRDDSKNNAYHYFAIYKRFTEVIVDFKDQEGIDETIYMLIGVCNKIHEKTRRGPFTHGSFANHPDEFIFQENWQEKSSMLLKILEENFPQSPWLAKLKRS